MPTISKTEVFVGGEKFMKIVKVDSTGEFTIALPPFVAKVVGADNATGTSKEDAERAFKLALQSWTQKQTTTKKVIVFSSRATARIMDITGEKCLLNRQDTPFSNGMSLDFSVCVCEESTIVLLGKVRYDYKVLDSSIPDSTCPRRIREMVRDNGVDRKMPNQLDWTQERENFFARITKNLEAIILQLHRLSTPEAALALLADSSQDPHLLTETT